MKIFSSCSRRGAGPAPSGATAAAAGYGLNTDFGGHGIGRHMHEDPSVPNAGRPGRGRRLEPGLVIAIEPMLQIQSFYRACVALSAARGFDPDRPPHLAKITETL